jgi:hypothetical protein
MRITPVTDLGATISALLLPISIGTMPLAAEPTASSVANIPITDTLSIPPAVARATEWMPVVTTLAEPREGFFSASVPFSVGKLTESAVRITTPKV